MRAMGELTFVVTKIWRALGDNWELLRGGKVLCEGHTRLSPGDHIQVCFRGVGGGGDNELEQGGAQWGGPNCEEGMGQTVKRMLSMNRLQAQRLRILATSRSGLRKEVGDLKTGKGKEQQSEAKEEAIPPLAVANLE